MSIVIVKISVPIMKNAFKMHLISASCLRVHKMLEGGLGGEGGRGGKPFWKSAFEPIVHRRSLMENPCKNRLINEREIVRQLLSLEIFSRPPCPVRGRLL